MTTILIFRYLVLSLLIIIIAQIAGCGGRVALSNLTAGQLYQAGKEKYDREKYLSAIEYFQAVVYNHPGESVVDTAQYFLAMSYFGDKNYELSRVEFNRLITNYPFSKYSQRSLFMRAVSFFEGTPRHYGLDQVDLETAIKEFEDFLIDFPESEFLGEAQAYLLKARTRLARKYYEGGVVYMHMRANAPAAIYFQWVIDNFTETEFAPLAMYNLAEVEYKMKHFVVAAEKYAAFVSVFPDHLRTEKARLRTREAAFMAGEKAFEAGELVVARQRLEAFKNDFPDDERSMKAEAYLQQLDSLDSGRSEQAEAKS